MPIYKVQFTSYEGQILGAQTLDSVDDDEAVASAHAMLVAMKGEGFTLTAQDRRVHVYPPVQEDLTPATASPAGSATYVNVDRTGGGLRVLLVDDSQEDGEALVKSLNELGIKKIIWVRTTKQAYRQIVEDKELFPDILLLELVLAGTSGIQLLAHLRASTEKNVRELPAVVITSVDSPSVFRRATNQRISAYLRKPVGPEPLRQALVAAHTGKVIEPPLAFGRSWIDDIEDEEDTKVEPEGPTLLARLLAFMFPEKKRPAKRKKAGLHP